MLLSVPWRTQTGLWRLDQALRQVGGRNDEDDRPTQPMDVPEYNLPEEAIAQVPVEPRDSARLLVAVGPEVEHAHVSDLPRFLAPGDVLVVNSSRVVPARLQLRKATGGAAEVLLLEARTEPPASWEALVRPGRRLAPGTVLFAGSQPVLEVGERLADGPGRSEHWSKTSAPSPA